ncbi:hypothetical protein LCGC14_1450170 [marine sediment metagenome]|uniref:Uncharacterized protein n=1 Tax=marine sediment metagenome TaxID=412755 RepID=A0A0F9JIT6_9ZZZZ
MSKKPSTIMVQVCGKTYTVKPKYIILQEIGTLLGKGPMKLGEDLATNSWTPEELATVIFCMIQSKGTPTLDDIGEDMVGRYSKYIISITEFLTHCMIGADEELEELEDISNEESNDGGTEGN